MFYTHKSNVCESMYMHSVVEMPMSWITAKTRATRTSFQSQRYRHKCSLVSKKVCVKRWVYVCVYLCTMNEARERVVELSCVSGPYRG